MHLHTGVPFWPIRDGLPAAYPSMHADVSTDVAIIGAGITGALAAYACAEAGLDTVVVDRDEVASGSTAATSGLLLYDTDSSLEQLIDRFGTDTASRVYRLGLDAIDRMEHLCRSLQHPCGFSRRPSLYLASRRSHLRPLEREYRLRAELGLDVQFFTRAEIEARCSFSAPGAIYSQGTAEIDCYRFTHMLLAAAAARGARIFDRSAVTAVEFHRSGVSFGIDGRHTLRARRVVWATGYDVTLDVGRPGTLTSTWAVVSEPVDEFTGWPERCLIWETARPYFYLRTTDDGRVLAGGGDERPATKHQSESVLVRKTSRLLDRTRAMFPAVRVDADYRWGGTFATTADGLPFIGQLPEYPHVWFALGYGGNGITFSVMAADIVRDALLGRPNADAPIFRFDRLS